MKQDEKTTSMLNDCLTGRITEGYRKGTMMTVKQMGDLLGLKKTERYWLLHKNVFESKNIHGKTMVDVASFEKWYAGQIHYRKVTGEEPGELINAVTYSIHDISEILGISASRVYALIRREQLETVSVDFRMRVPREAFDQWYSSQSRYCKAEEKKKENVRLHSALTVPQMAALLGIPAEDGYRILEDNEYAHFFKCVILDGQQRIMQEDFEAFLAGQDRFYLVDVVRIADHPSKTPTEATDTFELPETADQKPKDICKRKTRHSWCERTADFITIAKAAEVACVTRQAISKMTDRGKIGSMKAGGRILLRRNDFEKWLQDRDAGH